MGMDLADWARAQDWKSIDLLVTIGADPVGVAEEIRPIVPGVRLLCVVLPPHSPPAEMPDDHTGVVTSPAQLRSAIATKMKPWHHVHFLHLTQQAVTAEQLAEVRAAAEESQLLCAQMDVTLRVNAGSWVRHGLTLLPRMADHVPANALRGALEGTTGIVVGAGPGLDRNVEILKEWKGRGVICAVSTALPALSRAGIQPDIVTVVDMLNPQGRLEALGELDVWADAVLMPGVHSHELAWQWPANAVYPVLQEMIGVGQWLCDLAKSKPISAGGSVATLGYSILEALGCSRIILVGCDNAVKQRGKVTQYAGGIERYYETGMDDLVEARAWGGIGKVHTTKSLASYRQWFESKEGGGISRLNCTESGSRIEGWQERRLQELPLPQAALDVRALLEAAAAEAETLTSPQLLEALRKMAAGLDKWADRGIVATSSIDALLEVAKSASTKMPKEQPLLAALSIGPAEDAAMLPPIAALEAQRRLFDLLVTRTGETRDLLESAIGALEVSNERAA